MRVQVYRNLHTGNFSVRGAKTRLVIDHRDTVTLYGASFHVSEAGRQRMLRTGHKNVHAWIEGELMPTEEPEGELVCYDPRKQTCFLNVGTGDPVGYADKVTVADKKVWALNPEMSTSQYLELQEYYHWATRAGVEPY